MNSNNSSINNSPDSLHSIFQISQFPSIIDMKQFGSLVNYIKTVATKGMPQPTEGMGATILCYTDRHACTVKKVFEINKKLYVEVQQDFAKRIDTNGMSECQEYDFKPNPNGSIYTYRWCEKKQMWLKVYFNEETKRYNLVKNAFGLSIGKRDEYYDFSF